MPPLPTHQIEDPLNLRCRCGSTASLVLCEDRSWKVVCAKGHEGKPAKLPSDALAMWSLKLRRKSSLWPCSTDYRSLSVSAFILDFSLAKNPCVRGCLKSCKSPLDTKSAQLATKKSKRTNKMTKLPPISPCIECGKTPKFTLSKGKMPTKVYCEECDRLASSGIAPERAIRIWNRMNAKERS